MLKVSVDVVGFPGRLEVSSVELDVAVGFACASWVSTSSDANAEGDARKCGRLAWKMAGVEYVYSSSITSCGGCGARLARKASFETFPDWLAGEPLGTALGTPLGEGDG